MVLCIQAFMIPYCIIPFYKICKILEFHSLFLVQVVLFFNLSVGMWMFKPCNDFALCRALSKNASNPAFTRVMFVFLIRIILASSIGYCPFYLSDPSIVSGLYIKLRHPKPLYCLEPIM